MMATPSATPGSGSGVDRRRFPGVHSFQERERQKFCGRSAAIDELLLRVLSVQLLLQFAPSGVGKTSLLNAGLFPALRPHHYFPFIVRLNEADESLTHAVHRSLVDAARDFGLVDPVIPQGSETLRALLGGTQLWSPELLLLTPVVVFDQFEEIFTLRDDAFRSAFASQLGDLRIEPKAGGAPTRSGESSAAAVKIILSLREEYLGKLEQFSASIPDLFRERLRLAPLTAAEATEAMVEPARLPGQGWESPPFEFEPRCLAALIDFIDGASDSLKVIEALTLQLVCQRAESIAMQRKASGGAPAALVLEDFGGNAGLERLVRSYYQDELGKLADPTTQRQAQKMFEDGLLDPAGKRLMLEQNEIRRKYGVDKPALDRLVASSLLRCEPRNESVFYEISHDRLTESIAKHRKTRLPRWVVPTIAGGLMVMLLLGVGIAYVLSQARETERQARKIQLERNRADYALQLQLSEDLVSRLRDAGLSDALKRVLKTSTGGDFSAAHVKGLASALKLRHEGDIERDQGTMGTARAKFEGALTEIDALAPGAARGPHPLLQAERARLLQRLASLLVDAGESSRADARYVAAIEVWDAVLKGSAPWQDVLDAAEARIEFGSLKSNAGDLDAADKQFVEGGRLAMTVLRAAYDEAQRGGADANFKLGRAVQVFADAALTVAKLTGDKATARHALALAREAVRLRPLSFQARNQLGAALVAYGDLMDDKSMVWELLRESRKQFDDLGQYDPGNRRMQRERAALQVLSAHVVGTCAANRACKGLPKAALDEAKLATLEAIGTFRWLAGQKRESLALTNDVAWGLSTHASLLGASGSPALAAPLLDEAIDITRAAKVDPLDAGPSLKVAEFLQEKARHQEMAGALLPAIKSLDWALAEIKALPGSLLSVQFIRVNTLTAKIDLLRKNRQGPEAERLQEVLTAQLALIPKAAWELRRSSALQLNDEGIALAKNPSSTSDAASLAQHRQMLDQHEQAIMQDPFEAVSWQYLGYAQQTIATLAAKGDAAVGLGAAVQEAALRDSVTALWMAALLNSEASDATLLNKKYEARRELAILMRESNKQETLALAEQGVVDAKEVLRQKDDLAAGLFYLADASFGMAMLRDEVSAGPGADTGWQEAFRVALIHGERLAALKPAKAERQNWLGMVHSDLANRLDQKSRPAAAAEERGLALKACREALRLAKASPLPAKEEESKAASCLKDLADLGIR